MKLLFAALTTLLVALPAAAQQYAAADTYRVSPQSETSKGIEVVTQQCGALRRPDFSLTQFGSLSELQAAEAQRVQFSTQVSDYGVCVTQFINSYRRPGAPANSKAPDQAACAHSWAEDQATQTVREYGRACVDFSNRSMMDSRIRPWSGECYPVAGSGHG